MTEAAVASWPRDLQIIFDGPDLRVGQIGMSPPACLTHATGVIIGTLFRRGSALPVDVLTGSEERAILESAGSALGALFWGDYVAFLAATDGGAPSALRAPLGPLACYYRVDGSTVRVASDVELLTNGRRPSIDWVELTRHLAAPELRHPVTCLGGVAELPGGDRLLRRSGSCATETFWSPWTYIEDRSRNHDRSSATQTVRNAVLQAAASIGPRSTRALLTLSGGLDSSVVAAALRATGSDFCSVTFVAQDAVGDERDYARQVAAALDMALLEADRDIARIDVTSCLAARLPRPTARSFAQESARIVREVAATMSADCIVDGGGGDNIFCALQSVAPVADSLRVQGWSRGTLEVAMSLSRQTGVSVPTILRKAWARIHLQRPNYRWPTRLEYLSPAARTIAETAIDHPWLSCPPKCLPGEAAHAALLVAAQSLVESRDAEADLPEISPLLAQPVVEACLGIPSWLWFEHGNNRAVARRAFAPELPATIVRRRSKGSPDAFVADLLARNRETIRTMLLDGRLMDAGLLDRAAVESALRRDHPARDFSFTRILQLADAEAWAAHWA